MTGFCFDFCGASLEADPSGALIWPAADTLVVADLHFEKATALARAGHLLPPLDSRATLDNLGAVLKRFPAARVICLGDSFHDPGGPGRLSREDRATLAKLMKGRDWIWITGNHDPIQQEALTAEAQTELTDGPLTFRHEAKAGAGPGEVSGHYHPKASLKQRGRRLKGRCFLLDDNRLILPAFGAYTGGLDVTDPAMSGLIGEEARVLLIGRRAVHEIAYARIEGHSA
ncbi:MAG: ligase-associated DNA damage response endonuclease PdeM [Magnetovibrionaceae bacterium]